MSKSNERQPHSFKCVFIELPYAPVGIHIQPGHEPNCDCEDQTIKLSVAVCGGLSIADARTLFLDLVEGIDASTVVDPDSGDLFGEMGSMHDE